MASPVPVAWAAFHITTFDWSPGGKEIVFSYQRDATANAAFGNSNIAVTRLIGRGTRGGRRGDRRLPVFGGAESVLVHIQRLFWLERAMKRRVASRRQKTAELVELRRRVRTERSQVVIDRILRAALALDSKPSTMPKSKLGKSLGYLFNQKGPLTVFLEDPRIEIHNNDSERDLRHVVLGRNNWLAFASPRGGEVASNLYSLVLSCKHAGADPEAYLEDVLRRVSTTPAREIASLTPWAWAKARQSDTGAQS